MKTKETDIKQYTLTNRNGMTVELTNLGGRIMRMMVPDKEGTLRDIVQGFDKAEEYLPESHQSDFGAIIGRYANRLAGGRIEIEGHVYQLPQNNGPNCLHGGPRGWQYTIFEVVSASSQHLELALTSPDGDNGFPGMVRATVRYTLNHENALRIDYHAESDRETVINMTNHSYFNLSGNPTTSVLYHELWIDADQYTPTDATAIPLEKFLPVENTPMDFRKAKTIGRDIENNYEQLLIGNGYDHNYVLNSRGSMIQPCARLACAASGITMEVRTSAPGLQLYTGNFLDGVVGKQGQSYTRRSAVCLETQMYPDSPNRHWPESTGRLVPGKPFESSTEFRFVKYL